MSFSSSSNQVLVLWRNADWNPTIDIPKPGFELTFTSGAMAPPPVPPTRDPNRTDCLQCARAGHVWCTAHASNGFRGFCTPNVAQPGCGAGVRVLRGACDIAPTDSYNERFPVAGPVTEQQCWHADGMGMCATQLTYAAAPNMTYTRYTCVAGNHTGPRDPSSGCPNATGAATWGYPGLPVRETNPDRAKARGACGVAYDCLHGGVCLHGRGVCVCPAGFGGLQCEYAVATSPPPPCVNGWPAGAGADPCVCNAHFTGPGCALPLSRRRTRAAPSVACVDRASCSHHGECAPASGACVCDGGWAGLWCGTRLHPDRPRPLNCSHGGVYQPDDNRCVCPHGWTGAGCNLLVRNHYAFSGHPCTSNVHCGGHGNCTVGSGLCTCEAGWTGKFCEYPAVFADDTADARASQCLQAEAVRSGAVAWEYGSQQCVCTALDATGALCNVKYTRGDGFTATGYTNMNGRSGCLRGQCMNGAQCNLLDGVCLCPPGCVVRCEGSVWWRGVVWLDVRVVGWTCVWLVGRACVVGFTHVSAWWRACVQVWRQAMRVRTLVQLAVSSHRLRKQRRVRGCFRRVCVQLGLHGVSVQRTSGEAGVHCVCPRSTVPLRRRLCAWSVCPGHWILRLPAGVSWAVL